MDSKKKPAGAGRDKAEKKAGDAAAPDNLAADESVPAATADDAAATAVDTAEAAASAGSAGAVLAAPAMHEPAITSAPLAEASITPAAVVMPDVEPMISAVPEDDAALPASSELPSPQMAQDQVETLMKRIRADAESLSSEQRKHLGAHLVANPLHDLNEKCFLEVHTFRQMSITFRNLRANSKAFLSIRPDQEAIWSEGGANSRMVGLSFSTSTDPTLYLRNFLINAREMYLETYQNCSEIVLELYVRTNQHQLKGKVDLPPGASVTLESRCDRTSIIGLSSFGVDLE